MGRSKPLLPLGDRPVIRHCLDSLLAAGTPEVILVLGRHGMEIESAVGDLPVVIVRNENPDSDMAGSVRVGLRAIAETATAVLICLVDHPLVSAVTLRALIDRQALDPGSILIPTFQGKRGHPTLFPRKAIEELFEVPTLREVVRRDPARVRLVEVADEGTVLDMDTPDDYALMLERWQLRERIGSEAGDGGDARDAG
ncbi:MAG: hypothetical protein A2X84_00140 [Desulfuromonadaceae bacterium GWC2_58_13]|nr:MAG: hypothetical protein A2X84_00140 [Desulfuromonadaceae bacterium GWC2_58_13]